MIYKLLAIGLGGATGAVFRYLVYFYFDRFHQSDFPWATFIVNLSGSFLIGLLWGFFDRYYISPGLRMFIFIGLLGSFTTFSTIAFDVLSLSKDGEFRLMIAYLLSSNTLGIGMAFLGFYLHRWV
jgi:CrcB protein